jgi:hypothetical protein
MTIYRVHIYCEQEGSLGYSYVKSKSRIKDALKFEQKFNEFPEGYRIHVETHPTPKTQQAWLELLNYWGSHNDNG